MGPGVRAVSRISRLGRQRQERGAAWLRAARLLSPGEHHMEPPVPGHARPPSPGIAGMTRPSMHALASPRCPRRTNVRPCESGSDMGTQGTYIPLAFVDSHPLSQTSLVLTRSRSRSAPCFVLLPCKQSCPPTTAPRPPHDRDHLQPCPPPLRSRSSSRPPRCPSRARSCPRRTRPPSPRSPLTSTPRTTPPPTARTRPPALPSSPASTCSS